MGAGCGQLQSINLAGCAKVTDAGVSALVARCGQLQSINLARCYRVTDAGISDALCGFKQLLVHR